MSQIRVIPLGAGQDVGRSCVVVSIGGRNIMFDCGMHMGYSDERRFPNFKYIAGGENYTEIIDAVIISHFHLDHCGAIPYFTEMCGYRGPVYMTYPTKAICPILLEDFRKISVEKKGETNFFTNQNIRDCMKRVIAVNLFQTVKCGEDIEITAYYAGHVLGAAMFHVKVGSESVLYTGDYNTTPDRHLGAAQVEKLRVDLLITETTYATTIRDSKRLRERDFLKTVHETVARGGKVLIPVFALGRAQELCILIETYWERMGLNVPVYFSAGLVERANLYYKLFINWTNQKIKNSFVENNIFDFKHIKPFDRSLIDAPGPMVLFATPGMLHAGMSLDVFKKWCEGEKNTCIVPGFCVNGTVGAKILAGEKRINLDGRTTLQVNCQIASLSFSAHADAKGIMQLISQCEPKNVMLCHGERNKMQFLKENIESEFGIPCYDPANGETLVIQNYPPLPVDISKRLLKQESARPPHPLTSDIKPSLAIVDSARDIDAVLVQKPGGSLQLLHPAEAQEELGLPMHEVFFSASLRLHGVGSSLTEIWKAVGTAMPAAVMGAMEIETMHSMKYRSIEFHIKPDSDSSVVLNASWALSDDDIADLILETLKNQFQKMDTDSKKPKNM